MEEGGGLEGIYGMENELQGLKCFITPNQAEPPPVSPLRGCDCEKRQLMLRYSGGGVVDPAVWLLKCKGFSSGLVILKNKNKLHVIGFHS